MYKEGRLEKGTRRTEPNTLNWDRALSSSFSCQLLFITTRREPVLGQCWDVQIQDLDLTHRRSQTLHLTWRKIFFSFLE